MTDKEIDFVYKIVDDLSKKNSWYTIDYFIQEYWQGEQTSDEVRITILTATLPCKSKLKNRDQFYKDSPTYTGLK